MGSSAHGLRTVVLFYAEHCSPRSMWMFLLFFFQPETVLSKTLCLHILLATKLSRALSFVRHVEIVIDASSSFKSWWKWKTLIKLSSTFRACLIAVYLIETTQFSSSKCSIFWQRFIATAFPLKKSRWSLTFPLDERKCE